LTKYANVAGLKNVGIFVWSSVDKKTQKMVFLQTKEVWF